MPRIVEPVPKLLESLLCVARTVLRFAGADHVDRRVDESGKLRLLIDREIFAANEVVREQTERSK